MVDKKEVKGVKTFLAERKPKEFEVFQFTKEMLPKVDPEKYGSGDWYRQITEFNKSISIYFCHLGTLS